jgi:hypothetical protein
MLFMTIEGTSATVASAFGVTEKPTPNWLFFLFYISKTDQLVKSAQPEEIESV